MENTRSVAGVAEELRGLEVALVFANDRIHPFEELRWEKKTAEITDEKGVTIFKQEGVETPDFWSQLAANVVANKYFYGELGTPEREWSVKHLIHRVARTIADWGIKDGYFATAADGELYYHQLLWLLVNQYGSFNSPVWFNVGLYHNFHTRDPVAANGKKETKIWWPPVLNPEKGVIELTGSVIEADAIKGQYHYNPLTGKIEIPRHPYEYPQGSACFIQSLEDTMESIMELAYFEAMLFKYGSGTGTDLSTLRSMREKLSGGGRPSGPMSFLEIFDKVAGQVKSGGKTRRAAKMNTLKVWHPDILEFVIAKWKEEQKARALIRQGYDSNFNAEAYSTVAFQNVNLSVRVIDEFMRLAKENGLWQTLAVTTGLPYVLKNGKEERMPQYNARELLHKIAEAAWHCGDPGLQYEDTIQLWHTCPNFAAINSSNPCSEYMHVDDSACNLASINLMKFRRLDGTFDVEKFKAAVRIFITAQELIVDNASYPKPAIAKNAHLFRQLGLGYANLGSYLMSLGLPYDSDETRGIAGAVSAIMTGEAYAQSARIARLKGPFGAFAGPEPKLQNREPMMRVMRQHREAVDKIAEKCPQYLKAAAAETWQEAVTLGEMYGYRNAQATVIAPTGTISFMMDCDTTGIEPDIALVKYKALAGGGFLKIVNRTVPLALERLGYEPKTKEAIVNFLKANDTIEGAPGLRPEHLPVFDCAFKPKAGQRSISWQAHVQMMAAVQPFVSGAISKTVNMPRESTIEDIVGVYEMGWKLGLKALAIYRDGSKESQPLTTGSAGATTKAEPKIKAIKRLPPQGFEVKQKFNINGVFKGYFHFVMDKDGGLLEVFPHLAKYGSLEASLINLVCILFSKMLRANVHPQVAVESFLRQKCEPEGLVYEVDGVRTCTSLQDLLGQLVARHWLTGEEQQEVGLAPIAGFNRFPDLFAEECRSFYKKLEEKMKGAAKNGDNSQENDLLIKLPGGERCGDCGRYAAFRDGAGCLKCRACGWTDGGCGGK